MEATRLDAIPVVEMQQQVEARAPEDDWTGLSSPAERRKIQNRINQRIYRRRHTTTKRKPNQAIDTNNPLANTTLALRTTNISIFEAYIGPSSICRLGHDYQSANDNLGDNNASTNLNLNSPHVSIAKCGTICRMSKPEADKLIKQLEDSYKKNYLLGSPKVDHLLTLIQFNVFRALVSNDLVLGFKMEWMDGEAVSPFNSDDHEAREGAISCPASLRPTTLQRTVPHHPWIDLFPIPNMRDNMLRQGEDYDDTPLCMDLVEFCDSPSERKGMIVWGDPWDPDSWEVSEEFLSKWGWILSGCHELFRSTNYWRAKRGERPLVFKV